MVHGTILIYYLIMITELPGFCACSKVVIIKVILFGSHLPQTLFKTLFNNIVLFQTFTHIVTYFLKEVTPIFPFYKNSFSFFV